MKIFATSHMLLIMGVLSFPFNAASIDFKDPAEVLRFVKTLLPDNPVILEAGGHHGEDTNRMKLLWPKAVMHVFEPLPTSFVKLTEATQNLPGIFRYPYALSDHSGPSCFYLNPNNEGASSIGKPVEYNEIEFKKEPITIQCLTIDEWAKRTKINHIDFMWLDMEGHELYALQKGLSVLPTVKAIYTEINFIETRHGACLYKNLKTFLLACGFQELWKSASGGRQGDALFVRK